MPADPSADPAALAAGVDTDPTAVDGPAENAARPRSHSITDGRDRPDRAGRFGHPAGAGVASVVTAAPSTTYAAIAKESWFLPVGVLVSAVAAGLLGVAFGVDHVLVVLVPAGPSGLCACRH